MSDTATLPPHNKEAEEYVLGAMMISATAIDAVRPILRPTDFYFDSHRRIYRAALDLHDIGTAVDAITVLDELAARNQIAEIGGAEGAEGGQRRIRELATLVPATSNAPHHAKLVAETAYYRLIIRGAERIAQAGWDRNPETAQQIAREISAGLDERRDPALPVETWTEFEAQAHDEIPVLVDGLWPEAAFGFIAAPPKKGKTWIALALALAVATGRPFLGQKVTAPRPVLYVALEGHRSALRARVGAIARGMGLNPNPAGPDLANLHWIYKPRGLNLSDPAWASRLRQSAANTKAALTIIDVLRASARIRENSQEDFTALAHNLAPITQDGCSLAILHHFVKLSEISKERDPGERMSGTGAMFGTLDAAIYITGSHNNARDLRLEFDTRDIAGPDTLSITLEGEGTGPNSGFGYRDTATWRVLTEEEVAADEVKAPAEDIYDWIVEFDGDPTTAEICFAMGISDNTLRLRRDRLTELGIEITGKKGRPTIYRVKTLEELQAETADRDEQLGLGTPEADLLRSTEATSEVATSEVETEETSGLAAHHRNHRNPGTSEVRKRSEQGKQTSEPPNSPTESVHAHAREPLPEPEPEANGVHRLADHEAWIDADGYLLDQDQLITQLLERGASRYDLQALQEHAAARQAHELGQGAQP